MSGKAERLYEKMEHKAQRLGVLEGLRTLVNGTEELTDWKREVGKNADRISYKHPVSNRVMVRYHGLSSSHRVLDADVNHVNNQFGSVFGVGKDEVYLRLKHYLPHACKGYGTRGCDYVAIRNETDAEQFLAFLKSFLDQAEA